MITSTGKNVHERINIKGTIEAWARYTVKDWRKEMLRLKIKSTGALNKSLKYQILFRGDQLVHIKFQFLFYGRLVDMGVGNGVKIGDVAELRMSRSLMGRNAVNRRRAKKWYGKAFYYNVSRLSEIMSEVYARKISTDLVEELIKL